MTTHYKFESLPEHKISNDRAELDIHLVAIENLDSGDESPIIYRFGVYGRIFDRTWYSVRGPIFYNPSLDGGKFFFEKMDNSSLIHFTVKQESKDENIYAHIDNSAGTKFERITNHLWPYLFQMIKNMHFMNRAVLAVLNNELNRVEVEVNRAHRDLAEAKARVRMYEVDFIRKHNYYVRVSGGSTNDLLPEDVV